VALADLQIIRVRKSVNLFTAGSDVLEDEVDELGEGDGPLLGIAFVALTVIINDWSGTCLSAVGEAVMGGTSAGFKAGTCFVFRFDIFKTGALSK